MGGCREAAASVHGEGAYAMLKFESGVHRVQRVPRNDVRLHTSAMSVAVLPDMSDLIGEDEMNRTIPPNELRIDTYRAQGAGGQHVNTTNSAVRITHLPTGTVVAIQVNPCAYTHERVSPLRAAVLVSRPPSPLPRRTQDERSQHRNKAKAMKLLCARIFDQRREQLHREQAQQRSALIGRGDRSERIRTYNFAHDRVTDHRTGATVHGIERLFEGGLPGEFLEALQALEQTELLEKLNRPQ